MRYIILVMLFAFALNAHACKCPLRPYLDATDHARSILMGVDNHATLQLARVVHIDKNQAKVEVLELYRGTSLTELRFTPIDGPNCGLDLTPGAIVLLNIEEKHALSCRSHVGVNEGILQEIRRLKDSQVEALTQQYGQRLDEIGERLKRRK